jgi:DhnA family fructose-bisphosphate aldolase class Ia
MTPDFLGPDGRAVIVAIDHSLYSWPNPGLGDRLALLDAVTSAGADAVIASYGTIRDMRGAFGRAKPILKLDLTQMVLGEPYGVTDYVMAYALEDAARLGVRTVLTYIQLGVDSELEATRQAAMLAARCDREGFTYLCEIMPVESRGWPDPFAPEAIVAACRAGQELGGHAIKTTMPTPPETVGEAVRLCGVPVILAGGAKAADREGMFRAVETCMAHGAAGVAFGRNVWGAPDPAGTVRRLARIVHGDRA